jgi:hypothetical protein
MSFGGILATALAGGAGAIKDQATGDIEQKRRLDIAAETAKIQEQMQMRLSEFSEKQRRAGVLYDTTGEGGTARLDLARRTGEQANALTLQGKVDEAKNPELRTALDERAEAELQREIRKIQATAKPEAEKAAAIAEARAKMEAKYRKADPTVQSKVLELEKALGRKLTEQELLQATGLAKTLDNNTGYETVEDKEYDANGQEIRKTTRRVPIKAGQGGKTDPADPYAVPKRDAAPAAKDEPERKRMIESAAPKDPIRMMDDRSLQRIAETAGHSRQQVAQAELARRKAVESDIDTSGIGYGGAP